MEALHSVKRRLATILSADAKGYSRLMGEDEEATIRTLSGHREVMIGTVRSHAGRLVDTPGDNLLAEFPSVVEAVQCAIDIQRELRAGNAGLSPDRASARKGGDQVRITAQLVDTNQWPSHLGRTLR